MQAQRRRSLTTHGHLQYAQKKKMVCSPEAKVETVECQNQNFMPDDIIRAEPDPTQKCNYLFFFIKILITIFAKIK